MQPEVRRKPQIADMQDLPPTVDSPEDPYRPPLVTPDMITPQKLQQTLKEIEEFPLEQGVVPDPHCLAAKPLNKDLLEALWAFRESDSAELCSTALQWLGDSARIVKNRHLIGGLFAPLPILLALINKYKSTQPDLARLVVRLIANLCFDNPYLRDMFLPIEDGAATLLSCLESEDEEMQRVSCGCIGNLCSVTETICVLMHDHGATARLLQLLKSPNDNVQCMAARAVRNICETESIRAFVVSHGILEVGLQIIRDTVDDDGMIAEFFGVVCALITTKTVRMDFIFKHDGINVLLKTLIKATQLNLIVDLTDLLASWAEQSDLQEVFLERGFLDVIRQSYHDAHLKVECRVALGKIYCALSTNDRICEILFRELDSFIALTKENEVEIQVVAMMTIANLSRRDSFCIEMVEKGLAQNFLTIIADPGKDLRVKHYACAALRHLSIHEQNKPILLKMGVIPPTLLLLKDTVNHVVVHSAIGVIKSLLNGGVEYGHALVSEGGVPLIGALIDFKDSDHVKYESCRALGALLRLSDEFKTVAVENKAIPAMINLLGSKFELLQKEGFAGLKTLQPVLKEILVGNPDLQKSFSEALENLAFPKEGFEVTDEMQAEAEAFQKLVFE